MTEKVAQNRGTAQRIASGKRRGIQVRSSVDLQAMLSQSSVNGMHCCLASAVFHPQTPHAGETRAHKTAWRHALCLCGQLRVSRQRHAGFLRYCCFQNRQNFLESLTTRIWELKGVIESSGWAQVTLKHFWLQVWRSFHKDYRSCQNTLPFFLANRKQNETKQKKSVPQ